MFTAIYRTATGGTPDIAILATRNTDLTEAWADVECQHEGSGPLLTLTRTRVMALLERAQHSMNLLRGLDPGKFAQRTSFLFNDQRLGTVSVTWMDRD